MKKLDEMSNTNGRGSKLPFGIIDFKNFQLQKTELNHLFSNENLPYIGRREFKNKVKIDDANFHTEDDLYTQLFINDSIYQGLVISGKGGTGKTRLMYELGIKALADGWIVMMINPKFKGWKTLTLESNKKYCFLFDAIESNIHFNNDLVNMLKSLYPKVRIKIIANTRNTLFLNNEIKHQGLYKINLDNEKNEEEYLKYVIRKIFKLDATDSLVINDHISELVNKPSFAVYLLKRLIQNKEDPNINSFDVFSSYIVETFLLDMGLKDLYSLEIDKDIINFLFAMPIERNSIPLKMIDKVNLLEFHGWIYDSNQSYIAANNDTILEEIFIAYINKKAHESDMSLQDALKDIFDFSIQYGSIDHAFIAIEKIVKHSILSDKSDILMSVLQQYIEYIKKVKNLFIRSDILDNYSKFKFIVENNFMPQSSRKFAIFLARTMSVNLNEEEKKYIKNIFYIWINNNEHIWMESEGIFLIPVYLKLLGEDDFIIKVAKKYIFKDKNRAGLDFIYIALLQFSDHGDTSEKLMQERILHQFWNYYYDLMDEIIDAAIEKMEIIDIKETQNIFLEFINTFFSQENEDKFIQMYAIKNSDKLKVLKIETINNYLNEAIIFSRFFKKSDGPLVLIKEALIEWLYRNHDHESLRYLIKGYFDKGGDVDSIEVVLVQWINLNCQNEKARYVIPFYLENGGVIDSVEECVAMWINSYPDKATYVIPSYLKQGGSLESIREIADSVIQKNGLIHFAFEYLSSGGDFSLIEKKILSKLKNKSTISYEQRKNLFVTYFEYTKESRINFNTLSILSEIFKEEGYEKKISINNISIEIDKLLPTCEKNDVSSIKKAIVALLRDKIDYETFHSRILEKISQSYECLSLFYDESKNKIDEEFHLLMHINTHPHLLDTGCYIEQYLKSNYPIYEIEDTFLVYLDRYSQNIPPDFFELYCTTRNDLGLVNTTLLHVIKQKSDNLLPYATTYLKYGGSINNIRSILYQYLFSVQLGYDEVSFIYQYGLEEKLYYRIIGYMKYCSVYNHFYNILVKFLDANGELEQIEFKIIYFLKKQMTEKKPIDELFEEYIENVQDTTLLKSFVLETLSKEVDKKDSVVQIHLSLLRMYLLKYDIDDRLDEIIHNNYTLYKPVLEALNIIGDWVEKENTTPIHNESTLKLRKEITIIEKGESSLSLNEDSNIKKLLQMIQSSENNARKIFAIIKNKWNDFDDIDERLTQVGHTLVHNYILSYNYALENERSNNKYILLCTKYLKTSSITDELLNKIQNDVETFVTYENFGLMKKLFKRLLECRKIDLLALSSAEIIHSYPLLSQEYFGSYMETYTNITAIKREYIQYLEDMYLNRKSTYEWLMGKSYINNYLTNCNRDEDVDSIIIDILEIFYQKNEPFVSYVIKFIRNKKDFLLLRTCINYFIKYNSVENVYDLRERLKKLNDKNDGLMELEMFLDVNT